jgi:GDP-mannose 6-dehydrogenase
MKISVFGLGYVGSVCAACLADRGHSVVGVDSVESKVDLIRAGQAPIVEPEIGELIQKTVKKGLLTATVDSAAAVASTDMSIICVGTPSQPNGALGLTAIDAVSKEIGKAIGAKKTRHDVVIRSTVVPGTTREFIVPRLAEASGKTPGKELGVAFNPEFLREGPSSEASMTRRRPRSCRYMPICPAPKSRPASRWRSSSNTSTTPGTP